MSFSSEEIAKIHVVINSGDIPDFSEKMRDAAKSVSQLQEEIQLTQKDLGILAARGDQNSENFKIMQKHLSTLQTRLKNTNKEMKYYTESIDINLMSSNQLNARSKVLTNTLNALSKEAEPDRWNELNNELIKVRRRMDEVRVGTLGVSDSMDITGMSMQQLDVYSRQLKARLAAIPRDAANSAEWKKLESRLRDVTKEQEKLSSSMSGITGFMKKIAKSGAVGSVVTAVVSGLKTIGKSMIESTQVWGDRWNHFTSGMKKGWQDLMAGLQEDGGWKHMLRNFREGYKLGRELTKALDELFEMENSIRIMDAEASVLIAEQTVIMRDTTRSYEERAAAAQKIVDKEKEIAEAKKQAAQLEYDAALKAMLDRTGLSEETLEKYISYYMKNRTLIKRAEAWMEEDENIADVDTSNMNQAEYDRHSDRIYAHNQAFNTDSELREAINFLEKYNLANDEMILNLVNSREKMVKADADAAQASIRAATSYARFIKEINDSIYDEALADVEKQAAEESNIYKQKRLDREISEEEMNRELERIETERLQKVNDVNKRFGRDIVESTGAVLDNMISSMDGFTQAAADGSEEALDRVIQKSKELNAELERMLADSEAAVAKMMETEQAAMQASLDQDGNRLASDVQQAGEIKNRFADTNTRLTLLSADKNAEMAQLQSLYDQKLIAEEEFQAARNEVIRRYASEAFNIQTQSLQNGLQVASGFLNNISSLVSSIQEAESASLDAQMQKELAAAGDNADKRAAIEEKYEQKKLDLQKKYADIDMGIQIAQAIAAGALAIIQAWTAAKGNPVLAGIYTGLIAATTAAQVATIIAQRNAIKNSTVSSSSSGTTSVRTVIPEDSGYSEGGFTGYGGRLEPAGIVHRGEYVVPVPEMRDPEAYSHVMAIERIRSRRSTRNRLPGFADGGYTGDPSSRETVAAIKEMTSVFKSLRDNPIKAYTVLSEHNAAQEISNKFKKAASRK